MFNLLTHFWDLKFVVNVWSTWVFCLTFEYNRGSVWCISVEAVERALSFPNSRDFVKFSSTSNTWHLFGFFICHKLATPSWNLSPTVGLVAIILVEAGASYPPPRDEPSGLCLIVPGTNIHQHTRPASLKVAYFGAGLLFCLNAGEDLSEVFLWSCSICNSAAVLGTICIHQRCHFDGVMSTQCWEYPYRYRGTFVKFDSQHQDWFRVFLWSHNACILLVGSPSPFQGIAISVCSLGIIIYSQFTHQKYGWHYHIKIFISWSIMCLPRTRDFVVSTIWTGLLIPFLNPSCNSGSFNPQVRYGSTKIWHYFTRIFN